MTPRALPWQKGLIKAHDGASRRTADKVAQVRAAIHQLLNDPNVPPGDINANRISQRSDCPSHEFLAQHSGRAAKDKGYGHDLKAEISEAREDKRKRLANAALDADIRSSRDVIGLHAKVKTYQSRLESMRAQLQEERDRTSAISRDLKIALGSKLESRTLIDPAEHQQLRNHIERLTSQATGLSRQLEQCERGRREAIERHSALAEANIQLGNELRDCKCSDRIVRLNEHQATRNSTPPRTHA